MDYRYGKYVFGRSSRQNYQTDDFIQNLMNQVNVFIVPIVNPDGYVYSHTTDRYWRKNRQLNFSSSYVGTDLNRNWDADWNGGEMPALILVPMCV